MLMVRMVTAALAAVGLSIGGYELGTSRAAAPVPPVAVDVPNDHPISVALQSPVSQAMSPVERTRLVEMARSYRQDQEKAQVDAAVQATQVTCRLQSGEVRTAPAQQKLDQVRKDVEKQFVQQNRDIVFRKYSDLVLQEMTPKISKRVKEVVDARRDMDEERGFGLLIALRSRDEMKLTPHQVTKLQLLQSDFIRRFAPIREAYETRVDNLRWQYNDGTIVAKPGSDLQFKSALPSPEIKFEYFVEVQGKPSTKGKPKEVYLTYLAPEQRKGHQLDLRLKSVTVKPKAANTVIRYFVWTSDESLQNQLQSLKKEIDEKARNVLSQPQRKQLKEKIDQSLASGK